MANKAIVSLIPSASEIIFALKQQKNMVGRSHGCDFPKEVLHLPVLTRATFPISGTSQEIDSHVKHKLSDGLSVYEIFKDTLEKLAPDVILTQDQCDVCAASLKDVEDAVSEWVGKKAKVVSLKPEKLSDVYDDILKVAEALDVPENGKDVVSFMRESMETIEKKSQQIEHKPTVACIEWIDPIMAAGNWMPELVEMAGGINLFGEAGKHSPWMEWDELRSQNPDVILVLPCGFGIERSRQEMHLLTEQSGWQGLTAVRDNRVYVLDGDQYCNRPGPRLKESLEIIAEILHPEVFSFNHESIGWEKY